MKQQKSRADKTDEKRRVRELGGDVQSSPPAKRKKKGKVEERLPDDKFTSPDNEFVESGDEQFFDND